MLIVKIRLDQLRKRYYKGGLVRLQTIYGKMLKSVASHLFLGIDPTYLAPVPFIPVFCKTVEVEAHELGLDILETGHVIQINSGQHFSLS